MASEASSRAKEVYQAVAEKLPDRDSKELWIPLARELVESEAGLDVCRAQLEAELKQLEERAKRELDSVRSSNWRKG